MADLTTAQARGLVAWIAHRNAHRRPPTYRELAQALGFRAIHSALCLVQALVRKGYLIVDPNVARGSSLTPKGQRFEEEHRCCS